MLCGELNAVNVTTALNQVAKRPDGRKKWDADPTLASQLIAAARRFAQDGLARELASSAQSRATLQLRGTLLLEAICSRSLAQHFKPQGLSHRGPEVEQRGQPPTELVMSQALGSMQDPDPQCAANTGQASATPSCYSAAPTSAIACFGVEHAAELAAQGLANAV
eukprot:s712_g18.t3